MSVQATVFANYDNNYRDVRANSDGGGGGWWPDPGQHDCVIVALNMVPSTFVIRDPQTELPSQLVTFRYQLMEDPGSPGNPREFEGEPFNLPNDLNRVPQIEGQQTRIRMTLERLKGHLATILGGSSALTNNLGVDIQNAQAAIQGGDKAVTVRCVYTPKGDRVYKKDYLVKLL